jgi:hypothetical protein
MAEKKTTPIVIDDKEYTFEDMTAEQQEMVNHVADLDRKLQSTRFNMTQLEGGRKFFIDMLKGALEDTPEEAQEVAAQ